MKKPRVAIVCDWLTGVGGAELVLLELHKMFPHAPIYTSQYDAKKIDWFKDADVRTGWMQYFPAWLKKFLPVVRAYYFSHLKLNAYNVVISSNTGAECKGLRLRPDQIHVCYMHAPTHYYWSRYDAYVKNPGLGAFNWLGRLGLRLLIGPMRRWDFRAAQRPNFIVTNSYHSQAAIKQYYARDSVVVHPPIDTDYFTDAPGKSGSFIITGRQVPYKRFDLAVQACSQLNLSLKVIGDGPEHERLKKMAGPTVEFLGHLKRSELRDQLATASAFIFPGEDDFGIAPVEAMAAGLPVIAYKAGGALDYVLPGKTGEFFGEQTVESLIRTLQDFKPANYSARDIKRHAATFSIANFHKNLQTYLDRVIQ